VVVGPDSLYHIFSIAGHAGEDWSYPGNEIDFGHASSPDLIHWTIHPRVLSIDPDQHWKSRNLWAPHVLRLPEHLPGGYLMAYAGVDSSMNQAIGIAVSEDLFNWQDLSVSGPAYRPDTTWARWGASSTWSNCRDPFVAMIEGQLVLLTSASTKAGYEGAPSRGAIGLATSPDGRTWTDAGQPLVTGIDHTALESSHLARNPVTGEWHLLYTSTGSPRGIHYLTSASATSGWSIASAVPLDLSAFACELPRGPHLFSRVVAYLTQDDQVMRGVRFDSLTWDGGEPSLVKIDRFRQAWTVAAGDLYPSATFHDRPGFRVGTPSNVEGNFWYNSGEVYSGPYGGGCAPCDPQESRTGVLRSRTFTVSGRALAMRAGGTGAPGTSYIALVDSATATIVRQLDAPGTDVMSELEWDVSDLAGQPVYMEVIDGDPVGHVSVDAIRELPSAAAAPDLAEHRSSTIDHVCVMPNPSPGPATIEFTTRSPMHLELLVFDVRGRMVRKFPSGRVEPGPHSAYWDGLIAGSRRAPPGVYFIQLRSLGQIQPASTHTLVLAR
jgi:hypothetical protein